MLTTRRQILGVLGLTVAAPYVLRSENAHAAGIAPLNQIELGDDLGAGCRAQSLCPYVGQDLDRGFLSSGICNDPSGPFAFIRCHTATGAAQTDSLPVTDSASPFADGAPAYDCTLGMAARGKVVVVLSCERNSAPGTLDGIDMGCTRFDEDPGGPTLVRKVPIFRICHRNRGADTRPVMSCGRFSRGFDGSALPVAFNNADSAPDSSNVWGCRLNPNAQRIETPNIVAGGRGGQTPTAIATIKGTGKHWVAYHRDLNNVRTVFIRQVQGVTPVGAPIKLKSSAGNNFSTGGLATNDIGNVCTAFFADTPIGSTPRADGEFPLRVHVYDPNGNVIKKRAVGTSRIDTTNHVFPKVAALPDGRFVIVTDGLSGSTRSIFAWLVGPTGALQAGPVLLHSSSSPLETSSLIRAPNGHLWVSWTENLSSAPSSYLARAMRFRIT